MIANENCSQENCSTPELHPPRKLTHYTGPKENYLKKCMNIVKQKQIHRYRDQVSGYQRGEQRGGGGK